MHVTTGSLLKYRIVMSFYSVNSSGPFWALQSYGFTYINIQICSLFRVHKVHRSIYKQVVKKMWYSISAFYDTFSSHPISQFREKMYAQAAWKTECKSSRKIIGTGWYCCIKFERRTLWPSSCTSTDPPRPGHRSDRSTHRDASASSSRSSAHTRPGNRTSHWSDPTRKQTLKLFSTKNFFLNLFKIHKNL